jgi:hypothetical protein
MMTHLLRSLLLTTALLSAGPAAAQDALAPILAGFAAKASPEQVKQVTDAIAASPPLRARMEKLAASGVLKGVDLVTQEDERMEDKGARVLAGHILMTTKFLTGDAPHRRVEAKTKADLDPPNNLVFALGHMSYHLETPFDFKALPESLDARTNFVVREEAKAMVQAWNDLIDAEAKLKGRPITAAEAQSLIPNFKYREYIIKAQGKGAVLAPNGRLPLNGQTLGSMTSALFEAQLADFD